MELSKRAQNVPLSGIRKMFELAKDYDNVVNLCIGEPGFKTPENIIDAAQKVLETGNIKYSSTVGIDALRKAVWKKLEDENGIKVGSIDEIMITTGAGEALALSVQALINPGDEVIISNPYWTNYRGYISVAGGEEVLVDTFEEDGFSIKASSIEKAITSKTKMIILNSPSNPTGAVISKEEWIKIGKLAKKHKLMILSDEPYEKLLYDGVENFSLASMPEFKENVITVNSLSKTYAMTGWRVGYVHAPAYIIKGIAKLKENLSTCVNSISQYAAIEALSGPQNQLLIMVEEYKKRRDLLVNALNQLEGVSCMMPQASFYAFPNIKKLNMTSDQVAEFLIKEIQVVTTPGSAFGSAGEGYLRLSFASSQEDIIEAIKRLKTSSLFKK